MSPATRAAIDGRHPRGGAEGRSHQRHWRPHETMTLAAARHRDSNHLSPPRKTGKRRPRRRSGGRRYVLTRHHPVILTSLRWLHDCNTRVFIERGALMKNGKTAAWLVGMTKTAAHTLGFCAISAILLALTSIPGFSQATTSAGDYAGSDTCLICHADQGRHVAARDGAFADCLQLDTLESVCVQSVVR